MFQLKTPTIHPINRNDMVKVIAEDDDDRLKRFQEDQQSECDCTVRTSGASSTFCSVIADPGYDSDGEAATDDDMDLEDDDENVDETDVVTPLPPIPAASSSRRSISRCSTSSSATTTTTTTTTSRPCLPTTTIAIPTTASSSSQRRKRRVHFSLSHNQIQLIESRGEMSVKETRNYWWKKYEINSMKPDYRSLKRMHHNCNKKCCMRGLEMAYWSQKVMKADDFSIQNEDLVRYIHEYVPPPRPGVKARVRIARRSSTKSSYELDDDEYHCGSSSSTSTVPASSSCYDYDDDDQDCLNGKTPAPTGTSTSRRKTRYADKVQDGDGIHYRNYCLSSQDRARVLAMLDEAYVMEHVHDRPYRYVGEIYEEQWASSRCCTCFSREQQKKEKAKKQQQKDALSSPIRRKCTVSFGKVVQGIRNSLTGKGISSSNDSLKPIKSERTLSVGSSLSLRDA